MEVTEDRLLDGRVRYTQPRAGFRSGIEPIFLAAAVPARPGQHVLEAGCGAGAALLCLAARVPGISGLGVEQDPALVALAARNAAANGWADLAFLAADIAEAPEGMFDHACANPPYHAGAGTASPDAARDAARRAAPTTFAVWAMAMGQRLRHRGTLTWIVTASVLPLCVQALQAAGCPPSALLPLWPRAGEAAKLVLLQGIKGGRGRFSVRPGLVLHETSGRFTPDADAILRDAQPLPL